MTSGKKLHAVGALEGLTLKNDWKVEKQVTRPDDATGGVHSCSYIVVKAGRKCFLKAFDFSRAFEAADFAVALQFHTAAYLYERDLLLFCGQKKLRRVVHALDYGEVQVPTYENLNGRVLYLIFELADNNMRGQVSKESRLDTACCVRALKDVAAAMNQVHGVRIAHQDTKPSNVLLFGTAFRLADFGRASREGYQAVHDHLAVAGDRTYAPPEQLYEMRAADFNARRIGCDLYMLGNFAAFLFTGINVTTALFDRLDPAFRPDQWNDTYEQVLPYLQSAFTGVIKDLRHAIDADVTAQILPIIEELCNPDLRRRGHPKGIGRYEQYSLQRYDSRLDKISKEVEWRTRSKRKTG